MERQWKSATHCHSWLHYSITIHSQKALKSNHQIQPILLYTYFLLPVSNHEFLTNQLVSYLICCCLSCPIPLDDIVLKTCIKYRWPCQDESWNRLSRGERDITDVPSVGGIDQAKNLWLIQVTEAKMQFMARGTAKDMH